MKLKSMFLGAVLLPSAALSADVNVDNFVRAESDSYFRANLATFGADVGDMMHIRKPANVENQTVIRQNQDTLYSAVILDLAEPVYVSLPEIGGRYQSMQVVNQDHYMFVEATPGTYKLTQEAVGTRFASVHFRTFVMPGNAADLEDVHAAQDSIVIAGGGTGPFEAPEWDQTSLQVARQALNELSTLGFNTLYAFGAEDEVRPVDYLVGAAAGWGGLPATSAYYVLGSVAVNDGDTAYSVTVKDVPVDAFWSLTVYTGEGYLGVNETGINSFNNVSADPNADGSITVNFGACEDGRINCIPTSPGWNHAIRMYEPQAEIVNGDWQFPELQIVNGAQG